MDPFTYCRPEHLTFVAHVLLIDNATCALGGHVCNPDISNSIDLTNLNSGEEIIPEWFVQFLIRVTPVKLSTPDARGTIPGKTGRDVYVSDD